MKKIIIVVIICLLLVTMVISGKPPNKEHPGKGKGKPDKPPKDPDPVPDDPEIVVRWHSNVFGARTTVIVDNSQDPSNITIVWIQGSFGCEININYLEGNWSSWSPMWNITYDE